MDQQPRITDLIPKKYLTFALLMLAGMAVIGMLEGLYVWMPALASQTHDGRVAAFDLDGEGNLGSWYSSTLLTLASVVALVVLSVRRHKADDYHGRYRIWGWAAAVWLLMSIDESGSLHEGFKEMMSHLTNHRLLGDGSLWWVMAYGLVLGVIGVRLVLEMRVCRASTTALFITGACYAGAVIAQLGLVMPQSGAREVMVEEGLEMLGDLVLVLAMALHARYVILDAQGLIPKRVRKPADENATKRKKAKAEAAKRSDLDATPPAPATKTAVMAKSATPLASEKPTPATSFIKPTTQLRVDAADEDDADDSGDAKLSRAERKALRRAQRQNRQ